MTADLREYISKLKKSKEIKIIKKKVSTKFEIAGITAKADGTSALLFENIKQNNFNLVSNLVGTRKRFALAVNSKENKIHESIYSSIKKAKKPKITPKGKFFENTSKNLSELPIVTHFEKESGPFINSAIVYSQNHEFKTQNAAFHRLMPVDKTHFSIRMVEGRHSHRNFMNAKEHGEDLKVAITVGVHPAISIAGAYQADWGKDELDIANSLLGNKLTLTKCPYTGMHVPSGTEIVMEGKILQDKTDKEWMVEMLRTYDHPRDQPLFELEKMYYRNNPIFHDILSGYGEHHLLMGMPIESKLNGIIKKKYPSTNVKKIINEIFASHRSLKMVTIVDDDIEPSDSEQVEYAMATRFQADKDMVLIKNVRGSSLDPSSNQKKLKTAKLGIDATRPLDKRKEGFEIAKIPKLDKISLDNY